MTAVTIQYHKIVPNEVKDNYAPPEPSYGKKLSEPFGQPNVYPKKHKPMMFIYCSAGREHSRLHSLSAPFSQKGLKCPSTIEQLLCSKPWMNVTNVMFSERSKQVYKQTRLIYSECLSQLGLLKRDSVDWVADTQQKCVSHSLGAGSRGGQHASAAGSESPSRFVDGRLPAAPSYGGEQRGSKLLSLLLERP